MHNQFKTYSFSKLNSPVGSNLIMKITSLNTQRKNIQFDEFYPQGKILFLFSFEPFPFFNFLEKEKIENRLILYCFGPKLAKPARPISSRALRPHPGRNLGLGRQSPARPRARLGRDTGPFDLGHPF